MKEEKAGHPATPASWNHEFTVAHQIGASFASAHGHDHAGATMPQSMGACGLEPMQQADDNSQA